MIRVLETCADRSLHNKHGIVICAKRSFVEKNVIIGFLSINHIWATKKIYFKLYFQFENFKCVLSQSTKYIIN